MKVVDSQEWYVANSQKIVTYIESFDYVKLHTKNNKLIKYVIKRNDFEDVIEIADGFIKLYQDNVYIDSVPHKSSIYFGTVISEKRLLSFIDGTYDKK